MVACQIWPLSRDVVENFIIFSDEYTCPTICHVIGVDI